MKAATALEGAILKKTDHRCTLLPYGMINLNLKIFKYIQEYSTKNLAGPRVLRVGPGKAI